MSSQDEFRFLDRNDGSRIRYFYRKGTLPQTVLFLHGLCGSMRIFNHLFYPVEKAGFGVLSLDLPGHGLSTKFKNPDQINLDVFVNAVKELIKEIGIDRIIPVGYCLGTIIALELSKELDIKCEKAIFISSHINIRQDRSIYVGGLFYAFLVNAVGLFDSKGKYLDIDWDSMRGRMDLNIPMLWETSRSLSARILAKIVRMNLEYDGRNAARGLNIPVLIVHGRNDHIYPLRVAEKITSFLPQAELRVYEGRDHNLVVNSSGMLSEDIPAFISKPFVASL